MTICERLFKLMNEKNIKNRDLAIKLGVRDSVICNWKSRNTDPPSTYLLPICEILGIDIFTLLGEKNNDIIITDEEKQIIQKYRQLDFESQQAFKTLLHVRSSNSCSSGKSSEYKIG